MSIENFIQSKLVQTAVYWGSPQEDGYGGQTFAEPIEINCRWEDRNQVMGTVTGNQLYGFQLLSRSIVYVDRDLDEEGYLYLGTLADLECSEGDSDGVYYDPRQLPGIYIIKRFEKIPALGSTTEFLRRVYLSPWLT